MYSRHDLMADYIAYASHIPNQIQRHAAKNLMYNVFRASRSPAWHECQFSLEPYTPIDVPEETNEGPYDFKLMIDVFPVTCFTHRDALDRARSKFWWCGVVEMFNWLCFSDGLSLPRWRKVCDVPDETSLLRWDYVDFEKKFARVDNVHKMLVRKCDGRNWDYIPMVDGGRSCINSNRSYKSIDSR